MKRRWLFVTLLFTVLALGMTVGTVLAQAPVPSGASPAKSFAARVAAKLGLDEAKVQGAFNQAARDIQDEAQQQKLNRMVEKGRLTQEQADQIKQWYQSRPEALSPGFPSEGRGFDRGGFWGGPEPHGRGFKDGGVGGRGPHGKGFKHGVAPTPTP